MKGLDPVTVLGVAYVLAILSVFGFLALINYIHQG